MRKSFINNLVSPVCVDYVPCDQYPLKEQNINPRTGFARTDVTLFELAQKGLVNFDGNRLTPLPDVGQRTSLDNPNRKYVDTLSEKQEAYVQDQLRKQRKKKSDEKPVMVEEQIVKPAEHVAAE